MNRLRLKSHQLGDQSSMKPKAQLDLIIVIAIMSIEGNKSDASEMA